MPKTLILLGSGGAVTETARVLETSYPEFSYVQVSYGPRSDEVSQDDFIELQVDEGVEAIEEALFQTRVVGVINRFDSYIPLYGQLVEAFGVPGSSYASVMRFKDKGKMHRLMQKHGLQQYRPKTKVIPLSLLEEVLKSVLLPVVVKPAQGSKSRGVFFVRELGELPVIRERLVEHFDSSKLARSGVEEQELLVEEVVKGKQLTCVGWVDANGKYHMLSFEDVLSGRNVDQLHWQLVHRSVPSGIHESVRNNVLHLMQQIVSAGGLRSTFVFPEWLVDGEEVMLLELNVRVGGFRSEMLYKAYGYDLVRATIDVALGRQPDFEKKWKKSCTLTEVWEERSGVVQSINKPKDDAIADWEQKIEDGQEYVAPPQAQVPLAQYFTVTESDSLQRAQAFREKIAISWG